MLRFRGTGHLHHLMVIVVTAAIVLVVVVVVKAVRVAVVADEVVRVWLEW